MSDLTIQGKMNLVYGFVQDHTARTGFSPSMREIATGCGLSLNAVFRYLGRLEMQGRVTRIPGQARSVRVVPGPGFDPAQPDGSPGQPPVWCPGQFCPLLSDRFDLLGEVNLEKGARSIHE